MTDRELLEMAAKAADIKIWFSDSWHDVGECLTGTIAHNSYWNPLNDDGDAFRLAVKLRLDCYFYNDDIEIFSWQGDTGGITIESDNGDRGSCARRAIVRSAALIGAEKPSA